LLHVRKFILDLVEKNSKKTKVEAYEFDNFHESNLSSDEEEDDLEDTNKKLSRSSTRSDTSSHVAILDSIVDIREYDISYHIRTAIDHGKYVLSR
jgi:DNA polymerase elongation subunit (family B)